MGIAVLSGVIDNLDSPLPVAATGTGVATPMEATASTTVDDGLALASRLDSVPEACVIDSRLSHLKRNEPGRMRTGKADLPLDLILNGI